VAGPTPVPRQDRFQAGSGTDGLGVANRIRGSSFVDPGGLGIDLAPLTPNANDAGDSDDGANHLQNYPEVAAAQIVGEELRVTVDLDSRPDQEYEIDLLASEGCNGNGRGDGFYFGTVVLNTDAEGLGSAMLKVALPLEGPAEVAYVTGIATDEGGNTSETGTCTAVTELPVDIFADGFNLGNMDAWTVVMP